MCAGFLWYLDCGYNHHSLYLMPYSQNAIVLFLSMFSLIKKIKPISDCSNSNRCVTRFSWKVLIFLCSLRLCPGNSKKALHWWVPTILHSYTLTFLLLFVKNLAWGTLLGKYQFNADRLATFQELIVGNSPLLLNIKLLQVVEANKTP